MHKLVQVRHNPVALAMEILKVRPNKNKELIDNG
jgi:hypothetical protein